MKIKIIVLMIFVLLSVSLSGCGLTNVGVEELLTAPKLSKEQSDIYKVIKDKVGQNIDFVYPLSGDNRSAYVIANLDNEPTEEALVFYKKSNPTNQNIIRINVLDNYNGKWQSVYDKKCDASSIDKVIISHLAKDKKPYIMIGFNMLDMAEKNVYICEYKDGILEEITKGNYSICEEIDFDKDEDSDVALISNRAAEGSSIAMIISAQDGKIASKTVLPMQDKTTKYVNYIKGNLDKDTPALFVDCLKENGNIQTEVITYKNGKYLNLMNTEKDPGIKDSATKETTIEDATTKEISKKDIFYTERLDGYYSQDVNNDGIIEIPVISPFLDKANWDNTTNRKFITKWFGYKNNSFEKIFSSYYNAKEGYTFTFTKRWDRAIALKENTITGEKTFYKYSDDSEDIVDLLTIVTVPRLKARKYVENGFFEITKRGRISYLAKILNESDALSITKDELVDNFYLIN